MKTLYIRIHPLKPQRGYRACRMSIYGYLFLETQGWYSATFTDAQWDYLRNLRNDNSNPDSPRVFQIVDEAGKRALDEQDRQTKIQALDQPNAAVVDLTTQELRKDASANRAEHTRSMRAAEYDEKTEAAAAKASEPVWSDDLASPEKPAGTAQTSGRRGRGRPRKAAVTPLD